MSVNVVIIFTVKPEKLDAFREVMQGVKTGLPAVAGCKSVKILNELDNALVFILVESWDSRELHARHIKNVVDCGQWQRIVELLATEPVSHYCSEV